MGEVESDESCAAWCGRGCGGACFEVEEGKGKERERKGKERKGKERLMLLCIVFYGEL